MCLFCQKSLTGERRVCEILTGRAMGFNDKGYPTFSFKLDTPKPRRRLGDAIDRAQGLDTLLEKAKALSFSNDAVFHAYSEL